MTVTGTFSFSYFSTDKRQQCYLEVNGEHMFMIAAQQYPKCWQCFPAVDSFEQWWRTEEFSTESLMCLCYTVVQLFGFRSALVVLPDPFRGCSDHWKVWHSKNNPNYRSADADGFWWEMDNFGPGGPQMCSYYSTAKFSTFFLHEKMSNF